MEMQRCIKIFKAIHRLGAFLVLQTQTYGSCILYIEYNFTKKKIL